jgi:hypothetical protein
VILWKGIARDSRRDGTIFNSDETMKEIFTQLIAAAIDADKIPGLDYFDMRLRPFGKFEIVLNDSTKFRITVEDVSELTEQ